MKLFSLLINQLVGKQTKPTQKPASEAPDNHSKLALQLEQRLMFDAAGVLTVLDVSSDGDSESHDGDSQDDLVAPVERMADSPREMVFVDPSVENYASLLSDLPDDVEVVILDPERDGVEQIREALAGHSEIEALHIISHGDAGSLNLGGANLDVMNLDANAEALGDWGAALSEDADILIYGCDVAEGMEGGAFVTRMAELTGADIAASNDLTGAEALGGDWDLEVSQGEIEAQVIVDQEAQDAYEGILPNSAPVINNMNGDAQTYLPGSGAVLIDQGGNASITDDSRNFDNGRLTVSISSNRVAGEDTLSIREGGGVDVQWGAGRIRMGGRTVANFSGGTGTDDLVFELTRRAKANNISALIRAITYTNSDSDDPTRSTRTISFTITDGDGGTSGTVSATVDVPPNEAPVLTSGGALNYTENDVATQVDSGLTLADIDDSNMESATVSVTGNYQNGEDVLAFTDQNGITGGWDAASGTMTLTGTATKAEYQAALRSITFENTSESPDTGDRTISFVVSDLDVDSDAVTRTISMTTVNDGPVLSATAGNMAVTEGDGAAAVDAGLTLSDLDDTNMAGATVQITGNYQSTEDILSFTDQNGISGTWDSATGTMTLTGTATKAEYEAALQSVAYQNSNGDDPSTVARTVTFSVTDANASGDGAQTANITRGITVTGINDAPVATSGATLDYTENDVASVVDSGITLSDVDDADLEGATVSISVNYQNGEDVLSFTDQNGISGSWDAASGTMTLTGTATKAEYESALQSITVTTLPLIYFASQSHLNGNQRVDTFATHCLQIT